MFGFGRKKSQLEKAIEDDGIEYASERMAEIISERIPSREIAYSFILEELDGASNGNEASKNFADNCGINYLEYKGALNNSNPAVDGPDGPQMLLASLSLQLSGNQELMAKFRCKVDEKIMKRFQLGKFAAS